jgi:hypothetical protein
LPLVAPFFAHCQSQPVREGFIDHKNNSKKRLTAFAFVLHFAQMSVSHYSASVKEKLPTVTDCARLLGVHRVYLSNVIHGLALSKSLTRRIREELTPGQISALRKAQCKTISRPSKPKI